MCHPHFLLSDSDPLDRLSSLWCILQEIPGFLLLADSSFGVGPQTRLRTLCSWENLLLLVVSSLDQSVSIIGTSSSSSNIWQGKSCPSVKAQLKLPFPSQEGGLPRWLSGKKNPPANAGNVRDAGSIPGLGRSLEKEMATHSSVLVWEIPWTEEPGGLQPIRL